MSQGYVLTRYFYERLLEFEKDSTGFKNALPLMLAQIDVRKEQKRLRRFSFRLLPSLSCCIFRVPRKASY